MDTVAASEKLEKGGRKVGSSLLVLMLMMLLVAVVGVTKDFHKRTGVLQIYLPNYIISSAMEKSRFAETYNSGHCETLAPDRVAECLGQCVQFILELLHLASRLLSLTESLLPVKTHQKSVFKCIRSVEISSQKLVLKTSSLRSRSA